MKVENPQARNIDEDRVDRWECPFCDFSSGEESRVRSHINVIADSSHKNSTGYSVKLPAYVGEEKIGEYSPQKAEHNIASSRCLCDPSEIDLPISSDSIGSKAYTALKIWSDDLTLTGEEVKDRLREQGFEEVDYIDDSWSRLVDSSVNGAEFSRLEYAVVRVIEDMDGYSDASEVLEEYRSRGYEKPSDSKVLTVAERYEEAIESEEEESEAEADGGVAREEIEELLNSDLTEKQEAVVRAFNKAGLDTKSERVAEIAEEEFGVEVSSTYPNYIKREKILEDEESGEEAEAEPSDTNEPSQEESVEEFNEDDSEPVSESEEENSEETSDSTTNKTMSESTIPVDDVEQVHEKIELIEEFADETEAQVAGRIREMIDDDLLSGGENE